MVDSNESKRGLRNGSPFFVIGREVVYDGRVAVWTILSATQPAKVSLRR